MEENKINIPPARTIWTEGPFVRIIDQRFLPHEIITELLETDADAVRAIAEMRVRGAPLIGVTAAYGLYLAARAMETTPDFNQNLRAAADRLKAARPTAVNLAWAVDNAMARVEKETVPARVVEILRNFADRLAEQDVAVCKAIGENGLALLERLYVRLGRPVQILTHCNAGRLGCVEYGTATAPIYLAQKRGLPLHVWVDETRPRNQGALTVWELAAAGVPHTYMVDNAGGLLLRQKKIDIVIVGADRVTLFGEVANKIGTYLKALAAWANQTPFYVAVPASTFDTQVTDAMEEILIENRAPEEVLWMTGWTENGRQSVRLTPENTPAYNPGFDLTPPDLITGLITERGVCKPERADILRLFPEWR